MPDNTIDDALEELRKKWISRVRRSDEHDACAEISENPRSNGDEEETQHGETNFANGTRSGDAQDKNDAEISSQTIEVVESIENLGRGHSQYKPSVLLNDYVTYSTCCLKDAVYAQAQS